ncbi:conserved hypothetical protein [Neospora caninum Liverpool]|uniref:Transmembrane protein n=1 Tax=Neospora caninum (strain Liverpool) TaxID=572307 RepID=F0VAQ4_NEOCL|nr:conserved hypothetical protein [Neospora caninum Liverpool]CBZ51312.1 conserved hypothetical protein [Neospora caninum Liverpool]CEL68627.1 TPA: hypothetical protein BN1204_043780 [Neospora caninum Liverpool]|eukprot:XP_003881345.1 conserved hypothetical protein [Neospora caninum Liverpool]
MGNVADRSSRATYTQIAPAVPPSHRGRGGAASPAGEGDKGALGPPSPSLSPSFKATGARLGDPVTRGSLTGSSKAKKKGRGGNRRKVHTLIEVPRGIFSLLVNILMYTLQQFMLLYVIIAKTRSWLGLLFLIWDVPLLLYMCYSIKADSTADSCTSSRRCAVQWMTYTITLAVKMAAVAFVPSTTSETSVTFLKYTKGMTAAFDALNLEGLASTFPIDYYDPHMNVTTAGLANLAFSNNPHFTRQLVQAGESVDNFLVFVGICLLPIVYVVFTARAKEAMYPTINQLVSIEGLLHADLGVALTLDMLDIVIMFRDAFSRYSNSRWWDSDPVMKWICFAMVIVTIVGVVCLGFAFPTRSIDSPASASLSQTDMFISAKYAFLVGLFIVDIPFLALRIYWIVATDTISFFLFKNVYSLLTRPLRLNQCRLAEREKAKGTQKTFYDQDVLPEYREEDESEDAEEEETSDELPEEDNEPIPASRLPPGLASLAGPMPAGGGPAGVGTGGANAHAQGLSQPPYYEHLYGHLPGQPASAGLPFGRSGRASAPSGPQGFAGMSGPHPATAVGGFGGGGPAGPGYLGRSYSYEGLSKAHGPASPDPPTWPPAVPPSGPPGAPGDLYGDAGGASPYPPFGARGGIGPGGAQGGALSSMYHQASSGSLSLGGPGAGPVNATPAKGPLGFWRRFSNSRLSRTSTFDVGALQSATLGSQLGQRAPSWYQLGDGAALGGRGDGDRASVLAPTPHHGGHYLAGEQGWSSGVPYGALARGAGFQDGLGSHFYYGGGPGTGPPAAFTSTVGLPGPMSPASVAGGYGHPQGGGGGINAGGIRRRITSSLLPKRQSELVGDGPAAQQPSEPAAYRQGSVTEPRSGASPRQAMGRHASTAPVGPIRRRPKGPTRRERRLLRDLQYVRGIPVPSIGFWASLYRFFLILFVGGRQGLKTVLDDVFQLTWCQHLRMLIAPVGFHAMQGCLLAMIALSVPVSWKQLPGIAAWADFFPVVSWENLSTVDQTAVVIIVVSFALELVAFAFTAPSLDTLFVSIGTVCRLLSDYLVVRSIAISFAQQLPATPEAENGSRYVGLVVCSLFIICPVYHLLMLIVPVFYALCGKRLMSCRREKKKGYEPVASGEEWKTSVGRREVYSVSSALNFIVCRQFLAPISYNALLVGPDVMKGIRLLDNMVHAQFCDILITVCVQFYALSMHMSWYDLGIFLAHDVFLAIYALVGQTVRILAQRRFELKILLEELVLQRSDVFRLPGDEDEETSDEGDLNSKGRKKDKRKIGFVTIADIDEEYQTEGFFSSPGCIFPQIF